MKERVRDSEYMDDCVFARAMCAHLEFRSQSRR